MNESREEAFVNKASCCMIPDRPFCRPASCIRKRSMSKIFSWCKRPPFDLSKCCPPARQKRKGCACKVHLKPCDARQEVQILICVLKKGLKDLARQRMRPLCPGDAPPRCSSFIDLASSLDRFAESLDRLCVSTDMNDFASLICRINKIKSCFTNTIEKEYCRYKCKQQLINCMLACFKSLENKVCTLMTGGDSPQILSSLSNNDILLKSDSPANRDPLVQEQCTKKLSCPKVILKQNLTDKSCKAVCTDPSKECRPIGEPCDIKCREPKDVCKKDCVRVIEQITPAQDCTVKPKTVINDPCPNQNITKCIEVPCPPKGTCGIIKIPKEPCEKRETSRTCIPVQKKCFNIEPPLQKDCLSNSPGYCQKKISCSSTCRKDCCSELKNLSKCLIETANDPCPKKSSCFSSADRARQADDSCNLLSKNKRNQPSMKVCKMELEYSKYTGQRDNLVSQESDCSLPSGKTCRQELCNGYAESKITNTTNGKRLVFKVVVENDGCVETGLNDLKAKANFIKGNSLKFANNIEQMLEMTKLWYQSARDLCSNICPC